jgi:hypothetical protein
MPKRRYERREPTHEWQQIRPRLKDTAQINYEVIRPVIFTSHETRWMCEQLGIEKKEIKKGRPSQNYIEAAFGVQRRMADWSFERAQTWEDLLAAHENRWSGNQTTAIWLVLATLASISTAISLRNWNCGNQARSSGL